MIDMDPLNPATAVTLGFVQMLTGRFDLAADVIEGREAQTVVQGAPWYRFWAPYSLVYAGRVTEALDLLEHMQMFDRHYCLVHWQGNKVAAALMAGKRAALLTTCGGDEAGNADLPAWPRSIVECIAFHCFRIATGVRMMRFSISPR